MPPCLAGRPPACSSVRNSTSAATPSKASPLPSTTSLCLIDIELLRVPVAAHNKLMTDFLDVTIATEATICLKIFFDVMVFHDFHQRSKDVMFASDCSSLIMLQ